jgi:aryl-alcohol dehydrogenase-like predicted oxidoreductase
MDMAKRPLGRSGIGVSALGFGCWAIGGPFTMFGQPDGWGDVDDLETIDAVHMALDMGVTLFDTADAYGTGHSEEVLGLSLRGRRAGAVIATKGGYVHDAAQRALTGEDTSPAYIRRAVEASLSRLKTDYIDLYQIHNGVIPEEHFAPLMNTLEALKAEGKIRAYGWSTWGEGNARRFAGTGGAAIQAKLNLFSYDAALVAACEQSGLALLANGPLAMGMLTGKFDAGTRFAPDDVRSATQDWLEYYEHGRPKPAFLNRLAAVRDVLQSGGRTVAQGALGWLWAQSGSVIPIPGFKSRRQAAENAGALAHGPLSAAQIAQIERLLQAAE